MRGDAKYQSRVNLVGRVASIAKLLYEETIKQIIGATEMRSKRVIVIASFPYSIIITGLNKCESASDLNFWIIDTLECENLEEFPTLCSPGAMIGRLSNAPPQP